MSHEFFSLMAHSVESFETESPHPFSVADGSLQQQRTSWRSQSLTSPASNAALCSMATNDVEGVWLAREKLMDKWTTGCVLFMGPKFKYAHLQKYISAITRTREDFFKKRYSCISALMLFCMLNCKDSSLKHVSILRSTHWALLPWQCS